MRQSLHHCRRGALLRRLPFPPPSPYGRWHAPSFVAVPCGAAPLHIPRRGVASGPPPRPTPSSTDLSQSSATSPASSPPVLTSPATLQSGRKTAKAVEEEEEGDEESTIKRWYNRHTRDTLPRTNDAGLVLCFSQGTTDYCWKPSSVAPGVLQPGVLQRETAYNRIRLFGMPKGFPDTTASGFQNFFYLSQLSSFVSNFASSIGYQSLLSGFFLGSSPQLWMLKDLVPALMAAYLANRVVSYENRPKFWFVVSVFMNNASVISDMIIPWAMPGHLLAAAIFTSTVKQSSALMYFVTRAAALQHFAINNNLAELTKKFNSFGMVNYTVATALGIVFCTYIPSFSVQIVMVVSCCIANMVLSSMSVNPIAFRLLNFWSMQLILNSYIRDSKTVLTPTAVSNLLGVRMSPTQALKHAGHGVESATELIYVSPPIDQLQIRSTTLEEAVLYVHHNQSFLLGMWRPSGAPLPLRECWRRGELPHWLAAWNATRLRRRVQYRKGSVVDSVFGGYRLVLMIHQKCSAADLITAYLILHTAVLKHAADEATLRSFLRECHRNSHHWAEEGRELRDALGEKGWDVQLPILDHHNLRLSELMIPPSMRRGPPHGSCQSSPP